MPLAPALWAAPRGTQGPGRFEHRPRVRAPQRAIQDRLDLARPLGRNSAQEPGAEGGVVGRTARQELLRRGHELGVIAEGPLAWNLAPVGRPDGLPAAPALPGLG